jgi:dipeptide/tripeptide permease
MDDEEKQKNYELADRLLSEQNFPAAVISGAVATLLAAAAYGIIVATRPSSNGFAAAGIGIVIGLSMQFLGRGISMKFASVATVYAITGCVLGNLFRVILELARASAIPPMDVLRNNSLTALAEQSMSYLSFIDLVYWFVAVFCAVFFARRPLSRSERLAIGLSELRA